MTRSIRSQNSAYRNFGIACQGNFANNYLTKGQTGRIMARPREFDHQEALTAALMRLWRNGYARTSINDLAKCMGISRSSFYNAFGDREKVFLDVVAEYENIAPDFRLYRVGDDQRALSAIRDVFHEICVMHSDPQLPKGCLIVNAACDIEQNETRLGGVLHEMLARKVKAFATLYKRAIEQGDLPPESNADILADESVAFICGVHLIANFIVDYDRLWAMIRDFMTRVGFPPDVIAGEKN